MLVLVDNYDSFTYNLVQALAKLGAEVEVFRNDAVSPDEIIKLEPTHVVISPGPCTPAESGISVDLVKKLAGKIPLLGVCLGHQAIAEAYGGRTIRADRLVHGKTSFVTHDNAGVFEGLPNPFEAMRYHSLIVDGQSLPACFLVTARTDRGELMGIRHRELPVEGVQFHPESFMTPEGEKLLSNFLAFERSVL